MNAPVISLAPGLLRLRLPDAEVYYQERARLGAAAQDLLATAVKWWL